MIARVAVTVRIPTPLRPLAGGAGRLEAAAGTLGDVIAEMDGRHPGLAERLIGEAALRRFVTVWVDGEPVRDLSAVVADGAEVVILPAIAGGSRATHVRQPLSLRTSSRLSRLTVRSK
jgi:molybdopterin converting factor small subunit